MVTDANQAVAKYKDSRPDLLVAMKEFVKLLNLNAHKEATDQLPDHEKDIVEKVLGSDLAKEALQDKDIQKILYETQKRPEILGE